MPSFPIFFKLEIKIRKKNFHLCTTDKAQVKTENKHARVEQNTLYSTSANTGFTSIYKNDQAIFHTSKRCCQINLTTCDKCVSH